MSYQITKVANGFMVTPAPDMARDRLYSSEQIRVFATWRSASAWLNEQFKKEQMA